MTPNRCARHHRSPSNTRPSMVVPAASGALWGLPETLSLLQEPLLGDSPNTFSPPQGHAVGTFRTR